MVVLAFFDKYIKNDNVYKFSAFTAMIFCLLEVISSSTAFNIQFLKYFPLSNEGLAWLLPALISGFIAVFIGKKAINKNI